MRKDRGIRMKRLYCQTEVENDENRPVSLKNDKDCKTQKKFKKRSAGYERNRTYLVRKRVLRIFMVAAVVIGSIVKSGLLNAIEIVIVSLFGGQI